MPVQGFPDPYSSFSQGLSSGIQNGATIMQMIQQKAQAAHDNDLKSLKTWADMAADMNLPEAMVDDAYNRLAKPALQRLDPKTPVPENIELGDRKVGKKIKGIIEGPYDDDFKQKAIQSLLITAPEKVQATFKPYMDTLKEGINTQKLKTGWEGTPELPDTPAQSYGLLHMDTIPGYSGTPGIGATFKGLRNTDPMRVEGIKQKYLSGKGLDPGDLPKAEKFTPPISSDKMQGVMAEMGMDIRNPETYTPENIGRASAKMRAIDAQERKDKGEELNQFQKSLIAHQLRGELKSNPNIRDYQEISNKYSLMETALKKSRVEKGSLVAVDQALITLYNKMTDPNSVVRESEYARTPENMGVVNRVLGKLDKWKSGGAGLTDDERAALVEMGREFHNKYAATYNEIVDDYSKTAEMSGIDPKLIGVPYRKKAPVPATGGGTGEWSIKRLP